MAEMDEFPVVFIDPVYATVTSLSGLDDGDETADLKWIENCGMSGGIIKFSTQGCVQRRSNVSYYVKMAEETSTDMIADYFYKAWKLGTPNIVVSIISNPDLWKRWKNQKQRDDFQKGIVEAINTTSMWLLTDGTNTGVSKMIGNAIKKEKERRHLLAANISKQHLVSDNLEKLPKITAIGVIPTSKLSYAEVFETQDSEISIELSDQDNMSLLEELNPDLTNFIMLDQVKTNQDVNDYRLAIEKRFRRPVGKPKQYRKIDDNGSGEVITGTTTPLVGLLIQGGRTDIEHVCDLIKIKVPIVILKGTGSAADLFSFAHDEIKKRPDEEHVNSYVKPELLKRLMKAFPNEFKNDVLARNQCRDRMVECLQFSLKDTFPTVPLKKVEQNFVTVLDIDADTSVLQNLNKYILLALFESQEPQKGRMLQEQLQKNLKLTLDWNRQDLALSQIFQKYDWVRIKISNNLLDLAMMKKDRHKFVELFLDRDAIEVHKYFSHKKFLYLINHFEDPEFFRTICLGEMLGYSPISDYPVGKRFVYGYKCGMNKLLYKATYLTQLASFTDFEEIEAMDGNVSAPAVAERKAFNILVYWAALNFDAELTKTLWKKTEEPMAMAIIVSMIWHRMAKRWCPDVDLKRRLLASSKEFGKMAVQLLDYSYKDSNINTIALLDERLEDFNFKTVIELAHMSKNKHFIAHYICQKWLRRRWFGNLLIRKYDWGPVKIPNWVKIYLSLVLIFPMFIWIEYDLADKKRRQDKIMDDDYDEQTDVPLARHNRPVFVDDWIVKPTETVAFKMRSVWQYGRERLKVPIHLQFYYLWSAPITKFWLNQVFYIMFLILFSLATLYPYCGVFSLDIAVFTWILMIWAELVRTTFVKRKKYKEMDLFWTVFEIFVMAFLLMVILTARIPQYFKPFFTYLTTKFIMSLGLLYFYYRVLVVFLPISSVLGPMLISIKRMVKHDFLTWFRMYLIIMVSGAITMHAVLYPNFPLEPEGIRVALSRAFFAMFLTKIDDLEGAPCSKIYENTTVIGHCYNKDSASLWTRKYFNTTNLASAPGDTTPIEKCPYNSLGGYLIVIQYLLIVKLIMVTLLYALFSSTNSKVQSESESIYKYQKYSLIIDFEEKLILPPPLNIISYIIMVFQCIFSSCRYCWRRCCRRLSDCCKKKKETVDGASKINIMMTQYTENYSYWGNFVKKLETEEEQLQAEDNRANKQSQMLDSIMSQFLQERKFDGKLVEQISNLEQNVTNCQMALEELRHMIEKINPQLQPALVAEKSFIHVLSRRSPYPETTVTRFPVFDKYVPWEIVYITYDPVVYSCPKDNYPEKTQPYVDQDFLQSLIDSKAMSMQNVRESEIVSIMPAWNASTTVVIKGKKRNIDRKTYIKQDGVKVKYQLDTCNLPINPRGRTGLRGRGRLHRWGPNHNVMVVITRWKRKDNSDDFLSVDDKRVLEVIAIQNSDSSEYSLPRGGDYGYLTMYSAVCQKFLTFTAEDTATKVNPDMEDTDMIKFFRQYSPSHGSSSPFTSTVIYKGYFDDQYNTDNAWREVEVWNLHFDEEDREKEFNLKNKEKKWKTVSSYNTFLGSQDLILRQAANLHNAYY
ncbi:transient receptor potential cation channel subfamily M member-like 2 isoform X1 [Mytilus galloprovincialis]|uniref:transient receptor potential cation channel subfamily M member-like 2 isoform X1 n=1 Tax=Mytilus galloprovincialis TaxID=29158 RepID=UPI003F7CBB31